MSFGDVLEGSWILVLASLQHLAWILGINQFIPGIPNGLSKQTQRSTESALNTIVTNTLMSDLPELTKRFDGVFKNTRKLDDASLEHVIQALCKLSSDALEIGPASRVSSQVFTRHSKDGTAKATCIGSFDDGSRRSSCGRAPMYGLQSRKWIDLEWALQRPMA